MAPRPSTNIVVRRRKRSLSPICGCVKRRKRGPDQGSLDHCVGLLLNAVKLEIAGQPDSVGIAILQRAIQTTEAGLGHQSDEDLVRDAIASLEAGVNEARREDRPSTVAETTRSIKRLLTKIIQGFDQRHAANPSIRILRATFSALEINVGNNFGGLRGAARIAQIVQSIVTAADQVTSSLLEQSPQGQRPPAAECLEHQTAQTLLRTSIERLNRNTQSPISRPVQIAQVALRTISQELSRPDRNDERLTQTLVDAIANLPRIRRPTECPEHQAVNTLLNATMESLGEDEEVTSSSRVVRSTLSALLRELTRPERDVTSLTRSLIAAVDGLGLQALPASGGSALNREAIERNFIAELLQILDEGDQLDSAVQNRRQILTSIQRHISEAFDEPDWRQEENHRTRMLNSMLDGADAMSNTAFRGFIEGLRRLARRRGDSADPTIMQVRGILTQVHEGLEDDSTTGDEFIQYLADYVDYILEDARENLSPEPQLMSRGFRAMVNRLAEQPNTEHVLVVGFEPSQILLEDLADTIGPDAGSDGWVTQTRRLLTRNTAHAVLREMSSRLSGLQQAVRRRPRDHGRRETFRVLERLIQNISRGMMTRVPDTDRRVTALLNILEGADPEPSVESGDDEDDETITAANAEATRDSENTSFGVDQGWSITPWESSDQQVREANRNRNSAISTWVEALAQYPLHTRDDTRMAVENINSIGLTQTQLDQHDTCGICFIEFGLGERVTRLACGHWFHWWCIGNWLRLPDDMGNRRGCPNRCDQSSDTIKQSSPNDPPPPPIIPNNTIPRSTPPDGTAPGHTTSTPAGSRGPYAPTLTNQIRLEGRVVGHTNNRLVEGYIRTNGLRFRILDVALDGQPVPSPGRRTRTINAGSTTPTARYHDITFFAPYRRGMDGFPATETIEHHRTRVAFVVGPNPHSEDDESSEDEDGEDEDSEDELS